MSFEWKWILHIVILIGINWKFSHEMLSVEVNISFQLNWFNIWTAWISIIFRRILPFNWLRLFFDLAQMFSTLCFPSNQINRKFETFCSHNEKKDETKRKEQISSEKTLPNNVQRQPLSPPTAYCSISTIVRFMNRKTSTRKILLLWFETIQVRNGFSSSFLWARKLYFL